MAYTQDKKAMQRPLRNSEDPSEQWLSRVRQVERRVDMPLCQAWLLTPKHAIIPVRIATPSDARRLLWYNNEDEMERMQRWSVHPLDSDNALMRAENPRHTSVFAAWNPLQLSDTNNMNISAARILMERACLDPPMANPDHPMGLMQYFRALPAEHIVLFKANQHTGVVENYSERQIRSDWPSLNGIEQHAHITKPYEIMIRDRYHHASQALQEYQLCERGSETMETMLTNYIQSPPHAGVKFEIYAQIQVLMAALALYKPEEWHMSCQQPQLGRSLL